MEFLTADLTAQGSLSEIAIKVLLNGAVYFALARLLKGVDVTNFGQAVIAAVVVSILNATLGAILDFLSFPLRLITLGFFGFVVDAVLILLAARLLEGFRVRSFGWALLLAFGVAIFNAVLYCIFF